MKKIKGVGSATLDRGIRIVIAGVVLAGIISGINYMYQKYNDEKFLNDMNMVSTGVKNYYKNTLINATTDTPLTLAPIKKYKHLPSNYNILKIGDIPITAIHTNSVFPGSYHLSFKDIGYKRCMQLINNVPNIANFVAIMGGQGGVALHGEASKQAVITTKKYLNKDVNAFYTKDYNIDYATLNKAFLENFCAFSTTNTPTTANNRVISIIFK